MKIEFKSVKLANFQSYREAEYQFDRKGFTKVIGINETSEDNATSVGSGKTSIFSSISWALFGVTPSGIKDVQNIYNEDTCFVELYFVLNGKNILVKRTKRPSGLSIIVDGKDVSGKGIRDTEVILESHLGNLTSDLLNAVIILGQGLPHKLTSNSPSGRKELLEKLSQSDFMIEDLKTKVGNRENLLKNEKREIENDTVKNETTYNLLQRDLQKNLQEYENLMKINENEMKEICKENENQIKENEKAITNHSNQINQSFIFKKQEELTNLLTRKIELEDTSSLNNELITLRTTLINKKEELKKILEIKTVCPTCHQNIPHAHVPDTKPLEKEILEITMLGKEKKQQLDEIVNQNNEKENAFRNEIEKEKKIIQKEIQEVSENNLQLESKIKSLKENSYQRQLQIKEVESKLNTLEENKAKLTNEIQSINNQLELLAKEKEKINEREVSNTHSLQIISKMITILKRDFRGVLLKNVIEYLKERANYYGEFIFQQRKIKIELEGNNLNIRYNNKVYESLSGGEKTKIDIIIQLSIRDLLCQQFNFYSNLLVIDEVTDFLDEQSAELVYQLFSQLNVEQIYIISHRKDFSIPIDNELVIIKRDNYSRIEEK